MAPVSAGWGIGGPRGPASRPSRTPTTDGLTRLESDPRQALEIPRRRLLGEEKIGKNISLHLCHFFNDQPALSLVSQLV